MIMNDRRKWRLVMARDLNADKTFVYAVRSTGIYCRPSCPSKRPQRDRVEFFPDTGAAEKAGYRPSSRLYETASAVLGMTPSSYRKQAAGVRIGFTVLQSDLGLLLIAVTVRGICRVAFGKSAKELYETLRAEFPLATIERD